MMKLAVNQVIPVQYRRTCPMSRKLRSGDLARSTPSRGGGSGGGDCDPELEVDRADSEDSPSFHRHSTSLRQGLAFGAR